MYLKCAARIEPIVLGLGKEHLSLETYISLRMGGGGRGWGRGGGGREGFIAKRRNGKHLSVNFFFFEYKYISLRVKKALWLYEGLRWVNF